MGKVHYSVPPYWQTPCGRWLNFSGRSNENPRRVTCLRCRAYLKKKRRKRGK